MTLITHNVLHRHPFGGLGRNHCYFVGVVSNRQINFHKACLTDGHGISGTNNALFLYKHGKEIYDTSFKLDFRDKIFTIEYVINNSTFIFYKDDNDRCYSIDLPTNIDEITHWYPCVRLRNQGERCVVSNIVVK